VHPRHLHPHSTYRIHDTSLEQCATGHPPGALWVLGSAWFGLVVAHVGSTELPATAEPTTLHECGIFFILQPLCSRLPTKESGGGVLRRPITMRGSPTPAGCCATQPAPLMHMFQTCMRSCLHIKTEHCAAAVGTWDVRNDALAVGEVDPGDESVGRVGFLRGGGVDSQADAFPLGAVGKRLSAVFLGLCLACSSEQLVDRGKAPG
jgi:hypothetical protein